MNREVLEAIPGGTNTPMLKANCWQKSAKAKVTIDDTITESTSATRTFVSPPLEPGAEYNYNIKVEIIRDGRPVIAEKQITVRAGEIAKVAVRLSEDMAQR